MADLRTSSRRIMASYRGQSPDRVPICSPISWSPMADIDRDRPGGWRAEPGFVELARLVQQFCDPHPTYCPVKWPRLSSSISYQRFLEAPDEYIERLPPEKVGPKRTRQTTILHAPKGDLFWSYDVDEGIETAWDIRKPIQKLADLETMLSIPDRFAPPDPAFYEPFRRHRREFGRDCIAGASVNSMVAMLCGMMSFELLLEWVVTEPVLVKLLADAWLERTLKRVQFLLKQGVGPFWHFNGVERATPPMMGPRQWEELVVPYDGEVMRVIKSTDPEALIHVHCHGKVGTVLRSFIELGVDSTDPLEPPPQGDIELADARRLAGDRLTFLGNIEFADMEMLTPDQIEDKVRRAIQEGGTDGKSRLLLDPSATPHERHTPRLLANAKRYIEAGLKHGANR